MTEMDTLTKLYYGYHFDGDEYLVLHECTYHTLRICQCSTDNCLNDFYSEKVKRVDISADTVTASRLNGFSCAQNLFTEVLI